MKARYFHDCISKTDDGYASGIWARFGDRTEMVEVIRGETYNDVSRNSIIAIEVLKLTYPRLGRIGWRRKIAEMMEVVLCFNKYTVLCRNK